MRTLYVSGLGPVISPTTRSQPAAVAAALAYQWQARMKPEEVDDMEIALVRPCASVRGVRSGVPRYSPCGKRNLTPCYLDAK